MASRFTLSDEHRKLLAQIKFENTTKATKNNTLTTSTCLVHSSRSQKPVKINILTDLYERFTNLTTTKTILAALALSMVVNNLGNRITALTPTTRSAKIKYALGLAVLILLDNCLKAYFDGIADAAFDLVLEMVVDVCRSYLRHL